MIDFSSVDKGLLKEAREETHKAIQLVAMVPRHLLPHDITDSSASLLWNNGLNMLTSQDVNGLKVGFSFMNQQIKLLRDGATVKSIDTVHQTSDSVFEELKNALEILGEVGERLKTDLPYELPASVEQRGRPFRKQDPGALEALMHLYKLTHEVLTITFETIIEEASEITCWPHHYDLATLVTLEAHEDPEKAKSIGFGFSPGDGSYDEPYFYLTPWPYPDVADLYDMPAPAIWNTEGWVGGVLKVADLTEGKEKEMICDYFNSGFEKLKQLL